MRVLSANILGKVLLMIATLVFVTGTAMAAKRVALVIGNSAYEHTSPLKNPVNDANLMAISLEEAGFELPEDDEELADAISEYDFTGEEEENDEN